jgi:hypothetical protein
MSRKSRRAAVSSGVADVTDALQAAGETVAATVTKTGRRARKRASKLAARAADALPAGMKPAKPKRRKRKVAVVLIVLAGAGVAARKFMSTKADSDSSSGPRTPDE